MLDAAAPSLSATDSDDLPAARDETGSVARNALMLVAGQAATTALAIALSAALGRKLGPHDFGIYYLITTMAAFAYVVAEWGQPLIVIRETACDPGRSGRLLGSALALRAGLALLVTIPAGGVAWLLGYGPATTTLAVLLILAMVPMFLAQAYGMVFRAHDRMGKDATVSVLNKALLLGLALPALARGAGIPGVLLAQAVAGTLALALAARLYGALGAPRLHVSGQTARELLAAGAPILAMTAAASVQPYLDAILLSKLAPASAVGWLGAARNILGTLIAPASILGAAAYPRLARASADPAALRYEVRSALRPVLWLGALAGTGTYLFAGVAVGLVYGSAGFAPAAAILQVFAPGLLLLFVDILLGNVIYASGGGTGFAIAKVASVAVGTGLDVLLIPLCQQRYGNGGIGVMIAFALSELVVFAGALCVLRRGTLGLPALLDVLRALGAAAATIALFAVLPPLPPALSMPLCVALFGAASLGLGLARRRDLASLLRALRRGA